MAEWSRWWRPQGLGAEALHARFETHRYRPHAHPTWTVALMLDGAARFRLQERRLAARAGEVFVLAPDLVHTGEPASSDGYAYRVLYLPAAALHGGGPREVVLRDDALASALARLHGALAAPAARLERDALLLDALARLERHLTPAGREHAPAGGAEPRAVARARELLRERLADDVSLAELASHAGVGQSTLAHAFRAATGLAPHAFQLDLRVREARRLLRGGRAPADVALATGFYDQAHLTRVFKRSVGVAPAHFAAAA